MAPRNSKTSFFAPWSPKIASRRALDSPQQRPRRPHREAEGPKKPPRPSFRYRRLSVPDDLGSKSTKKRQQGTSPRHFRGDIGAVEFNVFLSFLLLMICFCFFFCFSFFSSALSVSFTIIIRLRPRRGLRLELRLRLRMRVRLGL